MPTLSGLELGNVAEGNRFDLIKHFVYAIVLVGLLGAGAWYVSRKLMPRLATARGRNVAVIENIPLGPNKMLHLIEVGSGRRLLVGSTSQSVSFLADVTACLAETPDAGDEQENAAP
ncbi:MAG TPA: flagellar biosynthetic protein FliO [Anaerohalosphaeraceae bacterium]|nr:flagellar biosynthetic protein FliO [Anaerohalosphaeraceae bacterium]